MQIRIISIDPSGTGITGFFIIIVEEGIIKSFEFEEFKSKVWTEHFVFITNLIRKHKPNIILYEDTTYVYGRQQQGTVGLCKLIGSIYGMEKTFEFVEQIGSVPVNNVKGFRDKIQTGIEDIDSLVFQGGGRGKGWVFKGKRINKHQVDAVMVYYLWSKEHLKTKLQIKEEIKVLRDKKRLGSKQKEQLEKLLYAMNKRNSGRK